MQFHVQLERSAVHVVVLQVEAASARAAKDLVTRAIEAGRCDDFCSSIALPHPIIEDRYAESSEDVFEICDVEPGEEVARGL